MELRPFFLLPTQPPKGLSWHPKRTPSCTGGPCRTPRCPSYEAFDEAFADSVVLDADSPICRVLIREHDA
jgi:hypothetical protein